CLEQLERFGDAMKAPVSVGPQAKLRAVHLFRRVCGQERLTPKCHSQYTCRRRQRQTENFDLLRAPSDVLCRVAPQCHGADMESGAHGKWKALHVELSLIRQRVTKGVDCTIEEQQHAVGLVDFGPTPRRQQVSCEAIMNVPPRV